MEDGKSEDLFDDVADVDCRGRRAAFDDLPAVGAKIVR